VRIGVGDGETIYGSGWATGRDGDLAYRASVGYTRYPRWTRETSSNRIDLNVGNIVDPDLGAENLRADLRGTYRIDKNNQIGFGGGFARVTMDVYGVGPFNDYNFAGNNSDVSVDYKGKYVNARVYYDRLDLTTSTAYSYTGHTLDVSHPQENIVNVEAEYVNDFHAPQSLHHDVHVGLGYRLKDITWEYLVQPTPVEHHASLYVQDTIKIADKVNVVGSGRVDYVPYLKRLVGSPRGSVVFKPTDRQAVRVSGSTAFRTPSFLEAYTDIPVQLSLPGVEVISATKNLNDPNFILQPEQVTSAEVGYLNQQSDYFDFEVTAYYNRVTNLIQLAPVSQLTLANVAGGVNTYEPAGTGSFPGSYGGGYVGGFGGWNNSTDVYNVFGGEVGAHVYPTEGLDLFANYAINYNLQQVNEPNEQPDQRTSHHKVNAGIQLRTKIGFNGEITFYYQSSQVWNEQVATLSGIVYQQFPLPGYTLLNLRLGWRFWHDRIEIAGTVFNALSGVGGCTSNCYGLQAPQMHPFGNQVGRRFMGFLSYSL
jgi:outer membrane receptor for ferrienterochelin and colicin